MQEDQQYLVASGQYVFHREGTGAAETPEGAAETVWSLNASAVIGACIGLCSPLAVLGQGI